MERSDMKFWMSVVVTVLVAIIAYYVWYIYKCYKKMNKEQSETSGMINNPYINRNLRDADPRYMTRVEHAASDFTNEAPSFWNTSYNPDGDSNMSQDRTYLTEDVLKKSLNGE